MDYIAASNGLNVLLNPLIESGHQKLSGFSKGISIRPSHQLSLVFDESLQKQAIKDYQDFKPEYTEFLSTREQVLRELEKVKFPGLSRSVLVPTTSNSTSPSSTIDENLDIDTFSHQQTTLTLSTTTSAFSKQDQQRFNFLEFEQGLPPANPWDTPSNPADDLKLLVSQSQSHNHAIQNIPITNANSRERESKETPPNLLPKPKYSSLPSSLSTPLTKISNQSNSSYNSDVIYNQVVSWGCDPQLVREGLKFYTNPQKVMDYCLSAEKYRKAGFEIEEFNDAIEICGKESPLEPRVDLYLSTYSRVKDVGFDRVRVRDALLKTSSGKSYVMVDEWSQDSVAFLLNYGN